MDPPECSGHSHDHEHAGDDLGLSLRPQIDLPAVKCLNEQAPNMGRDILKLHEERLSAEPFLRSQEDDPELLLYIPFTEAVTVTSLAIRCVPPSDVGEQQQQPSAPPRTIKLFTNRDNLGFEEARELEPQCKLEALPPQHFVEGTIDNPLRPAGKFQNISSLTLFFPDNYQGENDEVSTILTYVGLKGRGTNVKRMAVDTIYESKPMPKDHKVPEGEFGMQQGFSRESEFGD